MRATLSAAILAMAGSASSTALDTPPYASNCNAVYTVQSGDACFKIQSKFNNYTLDSFYYWNPQVNAGTCSNLYPGEQLCIGTTNNVPDHIPLTILPGTVSNCNNWYLVKQNDNCVDVPKAYGISEAQLRAWNPSIGTTYCGLQPSTYACVGVAA